MRLHCIVTRYKVAALSGFFLDHTTAAGQPLIKSEYDYIFNMQNMSSGVNQVKDVQRFFAAGVASLSLARGPAPAACDVQLCWLSLSAPALGIFWHGCVTTTGALGCNQGGGVAGPALTHTVRAALRNL